MLELDDNEKHTVINALKYISQGLTVDQREEFNHVANIVDKINESMKPENDDG